MIKTLAAANRSERTRFFIPRSVQQSIPIQRIFRDGIWQSNGKFTQTWRFADINYTLASHEDQEDMFRSYCAVLNSLPTDATTKITINNRRLNGTDFQKSVLMREKGDGLDVYRQEYNAVMSEKSAASNNLVQDKYITVSVARKNVDEARTFFHRVDADLSKNLGRLDSGAKALDSYIIVIDAEREYSDLIRALGGAVIEISPNSRHHINPLEISKGYGAGENPVAMKSELLMSICEQQMGAGQLGAFHKSIIDRCTASVYHDFILSGGKARQPVLSDWRNEVKRQPEQEAQELALASELFVEGSLNMFAHETNADIANRIVSFDLYEMGEQLKPTALNVTMETIQNRVAANRLAGKYTWVFLDEIYLFFKYYYSAQFLYKCWKRFRKYGAAMTGATQNVEECLRSDTARLMFANSEFLVLLNQAATDRAELARLLNISETQMGHVTGAEAGHGLLRIGGSIVPFANEFPRSGELYRLWSTTPGDK